MKVPEYKWSRIVRAIFDNKCAFCGKTEDEWYIHSHHIMPQSLAPDMANNIENGIPLCYNCHMITHSNGYNLGAHRSWYWPIPENPFDIDNPIQQRIRKEWNHIRELAIENEMSFDEYVAMKANAKYPNIISHKRGGKGRPLGAKDKKPRKRRESHIVQEQENPNSYDNESHSV